MGRMFLKESVNNICDLYLSNFNPTSGFSPYKNISICLGRTFNEIEATNQVEEIQLTAEFEKGFLNLFKECSHNQSKLDNYFGLVKENIALKENSAFYKFFQGLVQQISQLFQDQIQANILDA